MDGFERSQVPRCQEYCDENQAQFYCQECAAVFCQLCYDKEHASGNSRKSHHAKLKELRCVCTQHKHTLDYFNMTSLKPMCTICRKENLAASGNSHVIDTIEDALPKLKALLKEKLDMARTQLTEMHDELQRNEALAKNTAASAVEHLKVYFSRAREVLAARECELVEAAEMRSKEFLEGDNFANIQKKYAVLEKAVIAGDSLLVGQSSRISDKFSPVFSRLSGYWPFEKPAASSLHFTLEFPQDNLDRLGQLGAVSANEMSVESGDNGVVNLERFQTTIVMTSDPVAAVNGSGAGNEKQMVDQSTQTMAQGVKRTRATKALKIVKKEESAAVGHKSECPRCPDSVTKRRKRGGELAHELNKCDDILTHLWASDDSWPFARPVDKKQFPDYYQVIKNPINLGIIKDKVRSLCYESVVDFVFDMRQMFDNCRIYNDVNSRVYENCQRLEKYFNRLLREQFPNFDLVFQEEEEDVDGIH